MYDIKLRYLASAFVDAKDIVPTAKFAQDLAEAIHRTDLVPVTVTQMTSGGLVPRIGLRTSENDWILVVHAERIDFARLPNAGDGTILMDFETFCHEASDLLIAASNHLGRQANRLAAVQEGALQAMSSEQLRQVMERLLNLPPLYARGSVPEWTWHCVGVHERTFGHLTERMNLITKVSRIQGQLTRMQPGAEPSVSELDRIRIDLDTNTLPANPVPRFGSGNISDFFSCAPSWHSELTSEIKPFVEG
jgi:hypothetical protein